MVAACCSRVFVWMVCCTTAGLLSVLWPAIYSLIVNAFFGMPFAFRSVAISVSLVSCVLIGGGLGIFFRPCGWVVVISFARGSESQQWLLPSMGNSSYSMSLD